MIEATKKHAAKRQAKGKPDDFKEVLWMARAGGRTKL